MNDSYLDSLKNRFQKHVPEDFKFSVKYAESHIRKIINKYVEDFLPHAAHRIGIRKNELRKRLKTVKIIPSPGINGFAESKDGWKTFEIGINIGLMMFLHSATKLFASVIAVRDKNGHLNLKASRVIPVDILLKNTKGLMKTFWEGTIIHYKGIKAIELTDDQFSIAAWLLHFAEGFVVAHEFGHIVANTSEHKVEELYAVVDAVIDKLKDSVYLNTPQMKEVIAEWSFEIAADLIGLQILVECEDKARQKILAYSSVELVLIIMNMLEQYYEQIYKQIIVSKTHPSAKARLNLMRGFLSDLNPPELLQLGQAFEKLSNAILAEI